MVRRKDANVRFRSFANTQKPENRRMAEFGAEDEAVSVRFRPIADIAKDQFPPNENDSS